MEKTETIELSISKNYLQHWDVHDALRELYQNAFDQADEGDWFNEILSEKKVYMDLAIGNLNTKLERRTLILGESGKSDRDDKLGKFGEGYKLALVVLLRNGVDVNIINQDEIWTPRFQYSEVLGTEVLVVDIKKRDIDDHALLFGADDLIFVLSHLRRSQYHSYTQKNLKLQTNLRYLSTPSCNLLTDPRNKGKLFVGGLYVCKYSGSTLYGYDFAPSVFHLGRDRKLVSDWNATWEASKVLVDVAIKDSEVRDNLVENAAGSNDAGQIQHFVESEMALLSAMWSKYIREYPDTIPAPSEHKAQRLRKDYIGVNVVVVGEKRGEILEKSCEYEDALDLYETRPDPEKPTVVMNRYYDEFAGAMPVEMREAFVELMTQAVEWEIK